MQSNALCERETSDRGDLDEGVWDGGQRGGYADRLQRLIGHDVAELAKYQEHTHPEQRSVVQAVDVLQVQLEVLERKLPEASLNRRDNSRGGQASHTGDEVNRIDYSHSGVDP